MTSSGLEQAGSAVGVRQQLRPDRRLFLSRMITAPAVIGALRLKAETAAVPLQSPGGRVLVHLFPHLETLRFAVSFDNQVALERSELVMSVDGLNLSQHARVTAIRRYRRNEMFPTRGVHSLAHDRCNGIAVSFDHLPSPTSYILEVRAWDNGIAFRHVLPGTGSRVPDEATTFTFPEGAIAWYHDFEGHYEGIHKRKEIEAVGAGEWVAPPLTVKLPRGGYAAITEAALMNYPGMGLQADGRRGFKCVLGQALPVSHPFDLRYGKAEAERLAKPAAIAGAITTPWRVVMLGDLNTLVNCDIITSVSPLPDRAIFPNGLHTSWIKPGRAVWRYLDGGDNSFDGMKEFSAAAGELGFEYNVVEGFWQRWTEAQMRELVDFSRRHNVGIWFWKHSRDLRTPEKRTEFFSLCNRVGVVGAKIDFFDHEAKEIIDLYQSLLRSSAEHRVMVEFHGANKPAGESRTWPNEMTREAVRGLEYRSMETRAGHNTTLPFTRYLAGPADYTPMIFSERRKETSVAHQIASAVIFTSPLLIFGAHPNTILKHPAAELIKSIASVWDQTIVLPASEIGQLAIFARRSKGMWMLAIMNGDTARSVRIKLSFLTKRKFHGLFVYDVKDDPAAVHMEEKLVRPTDELEIKMRAGGGFVARFTGV